MGDSKENVGRLGGWESSPPGAGPEAMVTKCTRCDELRNCARFTINAVPICEVCLGLIVAEWAIKREEIGELIES